MASRGAFIATCSGRERFHALVDDWEFTCHISVLSVVASRSVEVFCCWRGAAAEMKELTIEPIAARRVFGKSAQTFTIRAKAESCVRIQPGSCVNAEWLLLQVARLSTACELSALVSSPSAAATKVLGKRDLDAK